jgi:hypothetical protein
MESIQRMLGKHNGSFPDEGDTFIEPDKTKASSFEDRKIITVLVW